MAAYSRVTRGGWVQGDDASAESRVTRGGWVQGSASGGGVTVAVPAGALTLTGYAPVVLNPLAIPIPSGALTLTGFAPVIVNPLTISIPAGSLVLTGFAPSVLTEVGGPALIDVPAGTLTLTGYAPVVQTPRTVSVPAGALTLTGYAPRVINGTPVLGPRLDEYPRLPSDGGQLALKLTDLMSRTNTRVNELSQGYLWAHFNATNTQPSATEGSWGDCIKNGRPREFGTPGSMYVIIGWVRLETDWAPMRVLTGN